MRLGNEVTVRDTSKLIKSIAKGHIGQHLMGGSQRDKHGLMNVLHNSTQQN